MAIADSEPPAAAERLPGRTESILAGLGEQNDPAHYQGQQGFWCQAECQFIPATHATWAIVAYRRAMAENRVAVTHNLFCPSIMRSRELRAAAALREAAALVLPARADVESDDEWIARNREAVHAFRRAVEGGTPQ